MFPRGSDTSTRQLRKVVKWRFAAEQGRGVGLPTQWQLVTPLSIPVSLLLINDPDVKSITQSNTLLGQRRCTLVTCVNELILTSMSLSPSFSCDSGDERMKYGRF
jgi:hypothetical protein